MADGVAALTFGGHDGLAGIVHKNDAGLFQYIATKLIICQQLVVLVTKPGHERGNGHGKDRERADEVGRVGQKGLGDAPEQVSDALPIAHVERELAEAVIADIPQSLLYARIDLIRDEHDQPLLAELELVEPSLFLRQEPAALKRLVRGIAARL